MSQQCSDMCVCVLLINLRCVLLIEMQGNLSSSLPHSGYPGLDTAVLHLFTIYGLPAQPAVVSLNNTPVPAADVEWNADTKVGVAPYGS